MSLAKSIRSEILKTRRTGPLYLAIGAAAFGPFMSMLDILLDGVEGEHAQQIFSEMLIKKFQMTALVAFPLFLILVSTLLPQIEYKNNTWKQVLTAPQSKLHVFAAKFINIQMLIGVFLITNMLLMLLSAVLLHFLQPSLNVLNQPVNVNSMLMARVNIYIALLAMCCIQFWLGLRFKSFIIPIAIGIACWFAGTIFVMQDMGFAAYFPYSFHAYGNFPKYDPTSNAVGWSSLVIALIFLILGYLDFRRKSMKS